LKKNKFGIVRDLAGHGVGHQLHEDPVIPNFGRKGSGPLLVPGMAIAIEPMATLGKRELAIDDDEWTIRTVDESVAAHFEQTVAIGENGRAEILTPFY
jgi:methionyl aminopeptidase